MVINAKRRQGNEQEASILTTGSISGPSVTGADYIGVNIRMNVMAMQRLFLFTNDRSIVIINYIKIE